MVINFDYPDNTFRQKMSSSLPCKIRNGTSCCLSFFVPRIITFFPSRTSSVLCKLLTYITNSQQNTQTNSIHKTPSTYDKSQQETLSIHSTWNKFTAQTT